MNRVRALPARLAAPARSLRLPEESGRIRLHTLQHAAVLRDLETKGVHRPPRWPADHDFAESYSWMHEQMARRLPTTGEGIIWSWAQIRRRDLTPDCPEARGEVLLSVDLPRDRVLLSHFGDWHCVLNRMIHVEGRPGEDDDAYDRRVDPIYDAFFDRREAAGLTHEPVKVWPDDLRQQAESSWTAIFDQSSWPPRDAIQATVHEIRAEDVVRAVRIC
ncbi:DUF3841 domain-containing protein [Aeromicrobium sp. A1-2]|uniref:DUF3841 domain-containing protein n=1 Tax=Aeromicrobium sp. A1-2 TaxID=2107713 RepID=UPI0013C29F98|nr:DUF3841 domain-containing protein [Aeromicrobium sp. A1-2]